MAIASWRDEDGFASFPDLYRPELLDFLLPPELPKDHLIAAYDGQSCVAFLAIFPRTLVLRGRPLKGCIAGLLTSRKEYLRRGIAEGMIRSAIGLNTKHGYDLAL